MGSPRWGTTALPLSVRPNTRRTWPGWPEAVSIWCSCRCLSPHAGGHDIPGNSVECPATSSGRLARMFVRQLFDERATSTCFACPHACLRNFSSPKIWGCVAIFLDSSRHGSFPPMSLPIGRGNCRRPKHSSVVTAGGRECRVHVARRRAPDFDSGAENPQLAPCFFSSHVGLAF